MSKKQKIIMCIITLVTLVAVLIALCVLPDEIPLHFGLNGASNVGSKFFLLIFVPLLPLIYWAICRKYKK